MKKLKYLITTEEGEMQQKLHGSIEENDVNFRESMIFLDLKEVESIRWANPYKGKDCCNVIMKSNNEFSIIANVEQLAEEVEKVKSYNILGIN